jgi:hypothetical protein
MSMIHGFFKDLVSMHKHNTINCSIQKELLRWHPFYLLGGKGYPLIDWIMIPCKEKEHNIFERL